MSLQVWLPMTKDLRQQGLSDIKVTNNGATFNSAGKLGGCYNFDGSTSSINTNINIPNFALDKTYSITCWVCPSGVSGQKPIVGIGPDWSWTIFQQDTDLRFVQWDESGSRWGNPAISGVFSANTWVHIGVVWNQGILLFYKNGEKIYEWTAPTSRTIKVSSDTVKIGGNIYAWGNNYFNGKLNDVRIYNHCLSPMEVKELSKGLVLHYPLNRQGWGQENLATCTTPQYTISASSTSNYNYFWINGNALEPNTTYTFSAEVEIIESMDYCTIFNYSPGDYTGTQCNTFPADGLRHSWTFTTSETALGLIGYAGVAGKTVNHSAIYKNIKIEKGDKTTPYIPRSNEALYTTMGLNSTTEYDTSGYCNNGIKNNSPTYSSDTIKYSISTHLDGVNQTIQLPNLLTLIPDSIFTFNIWFKRLASEPGSKAWKTILGGPSGFEIETCSANNVHDNKIRAYSWGSGMFEFELDKWNMLTMVSNGANALFYLNGELKLTGTYKALVSGNYFIGSWRDTATQNYKGYICDARIYATALSASDVKALYNANKL